MAKKKRTYYSIPKDFDIANMVALESSKWGIIHECPLTEEQREERAMLRAMGLANGPGCQLSPYPATSHCAAVCGVQNWSEIINKWAEDCAN